MSEAGDALIVSLPGTTRLGDWAANLSVGYEPVQDECMEEIEGAAAADKVRRWLGLGPRWQSGHTNCPSRSVEILCP